MTESGCACSLLRLLKVRKDNRVKFCNNISLVRILIFQFCVNACGLTSHLGCRATPYLLDRKWTIWFFNVLCTDGSSHLDRVATTIVIVHTQTVLRVIGFNMPQHFHGDLSALDRGLSILLSSSSSPVPSFLPLHHSDILPLLSLNTDRRGYTAG